ncbi:hypothetical protein Tco_0898167, partial [Tanacetum coccineum]
CFHALCQALKRRSSILDDDIGSDKRELGYTALQQKLLLMNESKPKIVKGAKQNRDTSMHGLGLVSRHATALRSLKKVDSPKFLSYPHDNQKSEVQHHERSEIEWLKALLHSNPYCSPSSLLRLKAITSGSLKKHGDERVNLHAFTTPMVTSRVLEEEIASPGITSSYGREEALTSSQSAFQHGGKMALKHRSSILDDDIRLGGPLRRIQQKANLLMLRDKRELGYKALQQPDHTSQKLLLMNESEPKIIKGAEQNRDTSMHGLGLVSGHATVPTKSTQTATKIFQHHEKMDL